MDADLIVFIASTAQTPHFWGVELWRTLLGTFVGAALGFGATVVVQYRQKLREHWTSGNLATFTLAQQLSEFRVLRRHFMKDVDATTAAWPGAPPWLWVQPSIYPHNTELTYEFKDLSFLIDIDPNLLGRLAYVERLFYGFVQMMTKYNEDRAEAQTQMVDMGVPAQGIVDVRALEARLGPDLVARLNSMAVSIVDSGKTDEREYLNVGDELSNALSGYFKKRRVSKNWRIISIQRALNVPDTKPGASRAIHMGSPAA